MAPKKEPVIWRHRTRRTERVRESGGFCPQVNLKMMREVDGISKESKRCRRAGKGGIRGEQNA